MKLTKLVRISCSHKRIPYPLLTLNKDYESIVTYLHYLQLAGLIRYLFTKKIGKAFLRKPEKIDTDNSNLIYASHTPQLQETMLGKARELFVVQHCQNANVPIFHSDHGDFIVDDNIIEVGGRNKTKKRIKAVENSFVLADGILVGKKTKIPLFLMGFLY